MISRSRVTLCVAPRAARGGDFWTSAKKTYPKYNNNSEGVVHLGGTTFIIRMKGLNMNTYVCTHHILIMPRVLINQLVEGFTTSSLGHPELEARLESPIWLNEGIYLKSYYGSQYTNNIQGAQYGFIKECTLNHTMDLNILEAIFLN